MDPKLRIVTRIPLEVLWDDGGDVAATRKRFLSTASLREMLKSIPPVVFYVADVGMPLRQIGLADCFEFWKSEVRSHLVDDPDAGFRLEDFPDGYAYVASEWSGEIQARIVLLEKYH